MVLKFCGFTRIDDIKFATSLGVDLIGIIFFHQSKRFVPFDMFEVIQRNVENAKFVGVFVNENIENVIKIAKEYNLHFVQLHGEENNSYIQKLTSEGIKVIKAFRVKSVEEVSNINLCSAEYILLDSFVEGIYGGTGKTINYQILSELLPKVNGKKIFLSGGINKDNIEKIIDEFGKYLYGIDLSSGIEQEPGIKSHILMKEVFDKFKNSLVRNNLLWQNTL